MNSHHIYDYIAQTRAVASPAKQVDTSAYQVPPPPRPVLARKPAPPEPQPSSKQAQDPFGTLRASKSLTKVVAANKKVENFCRESNLESADDDDDDVFHSETTTRPMPNLDNNDKFGTLRAANRAVNRPHPSPTSAMDDYRSTTLPRTQPSGDQLTRDEVRLADELLKILDEFQKKSYSAKEMEEIFENWRKRADISLPPSHEKVIDLAQLIEAF